MSRLEQRITALESACSSDDVCPHRAYAWCVAHRIAAPEPLQGESMKDWLKRVPTGTLKTMVESHNETR